MTTPEHRDVDLTYRWQPSIRVILVDAKGCEYEFPRVGEWLAEHHTLMNNFLTRKQCKALWRWLGRTDAPPAKLGIMLNREDVMRAFPAAAGNFEAAP